MPPIIFKDQEILPFSYLSVPRNAINTFVGDFKPGNTCEKYESVIVGQNNKWLANHKTMPYGNSLPSGKPIKP
jgi:hypothetical protein